MPYITAGLTALLGGFCFMIIITYLFFLPARGASTEMQTAYTMLVVPKVIIRLGSIGICGVVITVFLRSLLIMHKKAQLFFMPDKIKISGQDLMIELPLVQIKRILVLDITNFENVPKRKFKLEFLDKEQKSIELRLVDYNQVDDVLNILAQYVDLTVQFFDRNVSTPFDEEL